MPDDDVFCEECGRRLQTPSDAPLCLCGAPDGDLDEDGYCLQCGRRCRPAPGEHVEIEISPKFAAVSDRGLRHARNEDRCQVGQDGERAVMIVCDGVSSSHDGHFAAEKASSLIFQLLLSGNSLEEALRQAADAVSQLALRAEGAPSTTVVAASIQASNIDLAWVGDSRAYWIANTGSRQLTTDHSWLNDVVASGELSYAEAILSPKAHAITGWLGADAGAEMTPSFVNFHAPGEGWLLLCSDGLWNYAPEVQDVSGLIMQNPSSTALDIARGLVSYANARGGEDNISAALLRFED